MQKSAGCGLARTARAPCLHAAALPEGLEVRLLPEVTLALSVFNGTMPIDTGRESTWAGARHEAPGCSDRSPQFRIARLAPERVLHLLKTAGLTYRHQSSSSQVEAA